MMAVLVFTELRYRKELPPYVKGLLKINWENN